jgi:genome maintenance exonuclease 1
MFCRFQGLDTVVDFKTATKDKKDGWIEDYFLQSTCYAIMLEEVYGDIILHEIPQIAIVIAVEDGENKQQLFVKKTSDYREKVLNVFNNYHDQNPLPKAVYTPKLTENI